MIKNIYILIFCKNNMINIAWMTYNFLRLGNLTKAFLATSSKGLPFTSKIVNWELFLNALSGKYFNSLLAIDLLLETI
jgi:hypothetical protein